MVVSAEPVLAQTPPSGTTPKQRTNIGKVSKAVHARAPACRTKANHQQLGFAAYSAFMRECLKG